MSSLAAQLSYQEIVLFNLVLTYGESTPISILSALRVLKSQLRYAKIPTKTMRDRMTKWLDMVFRFSNPLKSSFFSGDGRFVGGSTSFTDQWMSAMEEANRGNCAHSDPCYAFGDGCYDTVLTKADFWKRVCKESQAKQVVFVNMAKYGFSKQVQPTHHDDIEGEGEGGGKVKRKLPRRASRNNPF
jgi:hypothetical protein